MCDEKYIKNVVRITLKRRSWWLSGLRRVSAAAGLLGLRVWIPPRAWKSFSCECYVLPGKGFCDGPIPRPERSYRVYVCHWVSGLEDSKTRLLQYKKKKSSRTGYMAEVLMGQYQMVLKIWGEVFHWIQLAQDQICGRSLSKQHEPSIAIKREAVCYLARNLSTSGERFSSMN